MITAAAILVPVNRQMAADLDGETVILDMEAGTYYGLDGVGARVWALMDGQRTVASICKVLTEEYDVGPDQCLTEVLALLKQLLEKGLIEVVDALS